MEATTMVSVDTAPKMKALVFSKYAKDAESVMAVTDVPRPTAAPSGFVVVKVVAAALNPVDKIRIAGGLKTFFPEKTFPAIVGYDLAGVVEAVGSGVTSFSVGDEVVARMQSDTSPGAIAEYAVVHVATMAKKPSDVSFNDAASLGLAGQTALQALRKLNVGEGSKVCITGGAGGVGTLAIQIAKMLGASTVATTASAGDKTELCKSLGADVVVNYRDEKFEDELSGYDAAFDTTKEAAKCTKVLTPHAGKKVVSIQGVPTVESLAESFALRGLPPPGCLLKFILSMIKDKKTFAAAQAVGADYKFLFLNPNGEDMATLLSWVQEGKLKPVIDSVHPLSEAVEAAKRSFSGRARGKVVVSMVTIELTVEILTNHTQALP